MTRFLQRELGEGSSTPRERWGKDGKVKKGSSHFFPFFSHFLPIPPHFSPTLEVVPLPNGSPLPPFPPSFPAIPLRFPPFPPFTPFFQDTKPRFGEFGGGWCGCLIHMDIPMHKVNAVALVWAHCARGDVHTTCGCSGKRFPCTIPMMRRVFVMLPVAMNTVDVTTEPCWLHRHVNRHVSTKQSTLFSDWTFRAQTMSTQMKGVSCSKHPMGCCLASIGRAASPLG